MGGTLGFAATEIGVHPRRLPAASPRFPIRPSKRRLNWQGSVKKKKTFLRFLRNDPMWFAAYEGGGTSWGMARGSALGNVVCRGVGGGAGWEWKKSGALQRGA